MNLKPWDLFKNFVPLSSWFSFQWAIMPVIKGIGNLSPSSLLVSWVSALFSGRVLSFLQGIIWTGVGLAVFFTLLRTAIRLHVFRRLYADDACVYFAVIVLLSTGVLTTLIVPIMFEFEYIVRGQKGVTAGFVQRVNYFLRLQFAIIVLFWTSIWAVKFSFLIWYRKLLAVPSDRLVLWWGVFTFTFLAYIGCWITQLESCRPISNYFLLGRSHAMFLKSSYWLKDQVVASPKGTYACPI